MYFANTFVKIEIIVLEQNYSVPQMQWANLLQGTVEIDDQVEVLQLLAGQCDYMDLSRLAVTGWSYGGYLSLMALAQRPDVFKWVPCGLLSSFVHLLTL